MRTKITILCTLMVACILLCNGCRKAHESGDPDAINCMSFNRDERLTVVANRDSIEDKTAFANLLIDMCVENTFKTIKFSTDAGYPTSLDITVYYWRDEIEGNDPVMNIEYKPVDYTQGYVIKNDPEQFVLYIDGEKIV